MNPESRPGVPAHIPGPAPEPIPEPLPEYWRWCPRCGHELQNEHCKLRCPACQYFMSCSDFD